MYVCTCMYIQRLLQQCTDPRSNKNEDPGFPMKGTTVEAAFWTLMATQKLADHQAHRHIRTQIPEL